MNMPNRATTTCLRPLPEKMDEFMPLWDERNRVTLEKDAKIEAMFAAIKRGDTPAYEQIKAQVEPLQAREDELSRQMRPLQFKVWEHTDNNLVTTVGKDDLNDKFWRASGYTQTVVMGLKGTGAPAVGDTQASHGGWLEVGLANAPTYTGNRKAVTMGASSGGTTVSPQQNYAITSTGTVSGLFMNNGGSATKDDTTGVLVSAVNFTGGDEAVNNLDSLLVTYTFNQA
jgi:hypothetical protein